MSDRLTGEAASRAAVARWLGDAPAATWTAVAIRQGRTVHRLRTEDRDCAVTWTADVDPERSRHRVRVARAAAEAGAGPEIVHADASVGVLVAAWVEGAAWTARDLRDPARLRALGPVLARLHGSPVDLPPHRVRAPAERYAAVLRPAAGDRDRAAIEELLGLAARHETGRPARPVHGDVTAGNLLGHASPLLVDWEYAGAGDPAFDLATVLALHEVPGRGRDALLEAYVEAGGPVPDPSRLRSAERLAVLLAWAWAAAALRGPHPESRASAWHDRLRPRI